jgi:isopenicillin-N epimerase
MHESLPAHFGHDYLALWPLDPAVTYLNHGTVGVAPRPVLAAQQTLRDEIERQPSRFLLREVASFAGVPRTAPNRMREAAAVVAAFVGARTEDVVFVDNASAGINAVLRSFPLQAGDEVLLTDHNYGATANAAAFVAREHGAQVQTVTVPYPRFDRAELLRRLTAAIGPRTRLAVLDHVTSESALIFPIADMVTECHARGVRVLVDGAHVPGMLDLDVPAIGADWYTANLHKWAHAPRSCAFLWAREDRQAGLHPPVISWGLDNGFTTEFDWVGTRDPSPWLTAPAGIAFLHQVGFAKMRAYTHDLAWRAATTLTARWGTKLERDEASVASMVTLPLPRALGSTQTDAARLRDTLLFDDHIEVAVNERGGQLWTRLSIQVYTDWSDIERLSEAVTSRR